MRVDSIRNLIEFLIESTHSRLSRRKRLKKPKRLNKLKRIKGLERLKSLKKTWNSRESTGKGYKKFKGLKSEDLQVTQKALKRMNGFNYTHCTQKIHLLQFTELYSMSGMIYDRL